MGVRALRLLRNGAALAFGLAIVAGMLLPVYTDEVGWRFQERAGFDGVDKLFSDVCGANTLARPPFWMMPVRHYSAFFNAAFADPFYVRLSGVLYALLWAGLLLLLIRRLAPASGGRAAVLGLVGFGLASLANLPLLLVMSRPEQPLVLAATAALLLALPRPAHAEQPVPAWIGWWRSLAIAALAAVALSYHLKGLFLLPLFFACLLFTGRGRRDVAPQLAAGGLLLALSASAAVYWIERLQCPGDVILSAQFARNNLGALLTGAEDWRALVPALYVLLENLNLFDYVELPAPRPQPLSGWLPWGQVSAGTFAFWRYALLAVWGAAFLAGLAALALRIRQCRLRAVLEPRVVLAAALVACVLAWSATQLVRNVYEASFVLPLLILAVITALAAPDSDRRAGRAVAIYSGVLGVAGVLSIAVVAAIWAPSLIRSAAQSGYIREQPYSVSVFGYGGLEKDIASAARQCGIPRPERAQALMVDDVTYFAFMESRLPQHRLGVVGLWRGSIRDPIAYLRSRRSDGIIVGCHHLPEDLRARARRQGKFCCLATPSW